MYKVLEFWLGLGINLDQAGTNSAMTHVTQYLFESFPVNWEYIKQTINQKMKSKPLESCESQFTCD